MSSVPSEKLSPDSHADDARTVLITGSSGLVGSRLISVLESRGQRVFRAVRREPQNQNEIRWRPQDLPQNIPPHEQDAFENIDAVVHLAGENIAESRWNSARKDSLRSSRVKATENFVGLIQRLSSPPKYFISASAIGIYSSHTDVPMTESSPIAEGFLGDLCRDWENASAPLEAIGTRVSHLRIGLVLSPAGGALQRLLPLFRMCLGSRIGSGRQWMSWIDLDDLIEIIYQELLNTGLGGVLNCTAPGSVRNSDFTAILATALRRPVAPPIPSFLIRLLFGDMGQQLILQGARVTPQRLLDEGYRFAHPDLPAAIRNQLSKYRKFR